MRLVSFAFAALFFSTLASAAVTQPPGLLLVDLTEEFDRIALSTTGMADAERITAFKNRTRTLADGFYARSRKPEGYDRRVLKSLQDYPEQREEILEVGRQLDGLFGPARASFERTFGPVLSEQPVYVLHSLGEMDGGTRTLQGRSTLIFGADVIARIHSGKDMTPFFHHELFHVYHRPLMGECDALWCALWGEGLATFVAASLNPGADDAALLLDLPAPIRPAVDADRSAAICAVIPLLDSEQEEDYAPLFYGSSNLPGFPARMGYYLGYLVAADLGQSNSLHQLAHMKPAQLRPLIGKSLDSMSTCARSGERG